MVKEKGKAHDAVAELLSNRGFDITGLKVAAIGRGPDRLILLDDETIGEYNCKSKKLILYSDVIIE